MASPWASDRRTDPQELVPTTNHPPSNGLETMIAAQVTLWGLGYQLGQCAVLAAVALNHDSLHALFARISVVWRTVLLFACGVPFITLGLLSVNGWGLQASLVAAVSVCLAAGVLGETASAWEGRRSRRSKQG